MTPISALAPLSPAPHGYRANPYQKQVDRWHNDFVAMTSTTEGWREVGIRDGVSFYQLRPAQLSASDRANLPFMRARTFIPDATPLEILSAIHIPTYKTVWDTRLQSASILARYNHYTLLGYVVYRGAGHIMTARDLVGCQSVYSPSGEVALTGAPDCPRYDLVACAVPVPDCPPQDGKVRAEGKYGYRIEREGTGVVVDYVITVNLGTWSPIFIYDMLSLELPSSVGRLRDAIGTFGYPPYVLDIEQILAMQYQGFESEVRETTIRAHAIKPGIFRIIFDMRRMYPQGMAIKSITGDGAHALSFQSIENVVIFRAAPSALKQEFVITLEPKDREQLPTNPSAWW